jgi:hypothetical protein
MKIKKIIETELKEFSIQIKFNVEENGTVKDCLTYNYVCPSCAGYGCMQNKGNGCFGGSITESLDKDNLSIPEEVSSKIKEKLLEIANSIK